MRARRRVGPRGRCSCAAWSRVTDTQALVALFSLDNAARLTPPQNVCVCPQSLVNVPFVPGFGYAGNPSPGGAGDTPGGGGSGRVKKSVAKKVAAPRLTPGPTSSRANARAAARSEPGGACVSSVPGQAPGRLN